MSEWISTKRKPPKCPCLVVRKEKRRPVIAECVTEVNGWPPKCQCLVALKNDQRPVIAEHVKKTDVPKDEKWYAFGKFNAIDLINIGRILYKFRITHWMPLPSPPGEEDDREDL